MKGTNQHQQLSPTLLFRSDAAISSMSCWSTRSFRSCSTDLCINAPFKFTWTLQPWETASHPRWRSSDQFWDAASLVTSPKNERSWFVWCWPWESHLMGHQPLFNRSTSCHGPLLLATAYGCTPNKVHDLLQQQEPTTNNNHKNQP